VPRLIDPPAGAALDLAEVAARLDESGVDLTDEGSIAHCTALLAGLARNRDFLADSVVAALKASYAGQLELNRYSAQVFLLHRSARGFYLRANLWPSARDAVYSASGPAAFSYGVPHDHNFSFLTRRYFGPGYVSDYYEYDAEAVDGRLGEPLDLQFVERSSLSEGKMMLYRAHRDIHSQLPPDSLSVSLNIMDEGEHVPLARPVYRRPRSRHDRKAPDVDQRRNAAPLRGAFDREWARHRRTIRQGAPVPRVRANAIASLAAAAEGDGRHIVFERGMMDADARVRADCRRWLAH
jgi:hypothetical protein